MTCGSELGEQNLKQKRCFIAAVRRRRLNLRRAVDVTRGQPFKQRQPPQGRNTFGSERKGVYKEWWSGTEAKTPGSLLNSQLRERVKHDRMIVSPLWRGPGNIHGFVLDGKSSDKDGLCSNTK